MRLTNDLDINRNFHNINIQIENSIIYLQNCFFIRSNFDSIVIDHT